MIVYIHIHVRVWVFSEWCVHVWSCSCIGHFGPLQAFTGISLTVVAQHCMAILIFHAMHLTAYSLITSMMDRHWVGIQCEASGASKAKPTVAEVSEDHAHVWFNHFNYALLVAVRCEASGASEATPVVAEASGSYLYTLNIGQPAPHCVNLNFSSIYS